ncbi:hypothetical protein ACQW02_22330 [Humitalea sp. 24SJ18S-53]|uniref:hypothetical protein n=1 Tax=Humitalea sp. 24SJ18S-53 TaxID=3422307 RepID=UPI003D6728A4
MSHPPVATPPNRAADAEPFAEDVAAYLTAHPRFLAERPGLYDALEPPQRVHGDRLADHMAAMLAAARAGGQAAAAGRARVQALGERVHAAVLALIDEPDPYATVAEDWPRLLGLAACSVQTEAPAHPRPLPPGTIAGLLSPGRDLVLRDTAPAAAALHGEAAPLVVREALLRLALPVPGLLVLGARSPGTLPMRGGTASLLFLAAALTAVLGR